MFVTAVGEEEMMGKRKFCRIASREILCERLTKRVNISSNVIVPSSSDRVLTTTPPEAQKNVEDCRELLDLLLLKAGVDIAENDTDGIELQVIEALKKEYSPRAAELMVKLVTGGGYLSDVVSDISSDVSGDEVDVQAVPTVPSDLTVEDVVIVPRPEPQSPPPPPTEAAPPTAKYNQETEIAFSRIFDLGKAAAVVDPSIPPTAPYHGPSVITMSGFGRLGRFGNQVLQYIFLKCFAKVNNVSKIQVPEWIGSALFGLNDENVQRALPAVIEYRGTKANSTFTSEFIEYIEASNNGGETKELGLDALNGAFGGEGLENVDVWGWFQWHTSKYAPFKKMIQDCFEPVPLLKQHLDSLFEEKIRYHGGVRRTVVGIHIRRGDYKSIALSSFGYCAPTSWYLDWLAEIWPTLDNPVLLITSDEVDAVFDDFAAYKPITGQMVGFDLPQEFKGRKAGFFPDWYALIKCDVLGISNSTFSFTACMMNKNPDARFYRAHYAKQMVEFNPWNADPIIHRDIKKNSIAQALQSLQVVYSTEGSRGVLKNMLYKMPYHAVRSLIIKAVLWREARAKTYKQTEFQQEQVIVPVV